MSSLHRFEGNEGYTTQMFRTLSHSGRIAVRLGASALGLISLAGCQSVNINAGNVAQVRFIQASPDAPGIDFYANNAAEAYNVGFGYGTSYVPVSPGTYTIQADKADTRTVLATAGQGMAIGQQYTVLVGNTLGSLQETILTDQSTPAPTNEISVRVIDEATRVGAVDIYLVPSSGKLATTALLTNLTNLTFGTNTGYINIPAGTYAIAVVPTGTVPVSTTVTLLSGPQVGYAVGAVRTVVIIDQQVTTTPGVAAFVADDYDSPSS
ncbi:MAG: DUF4397 domain-containing protein [Acidobacteriota bacterium]